MTEFFFPNAYADPVTTLNDAGGINSSVNTFTVASLPTGLLGTETNIVIQIDSELMLVTSLGATPFLNWTVTRGYETTTAASHSDGADIHFRLTKAQIESLRDYVAPLTLDIPAEAVPSQTADGRAVWDSNDDKLTVGTGSDRKTLMNVGDVLTADEHASFSEFAEIAAPSTPASGKVRIYAKSDGHFYAKDDAGTEYDLASAAGAFDLGDAGDVVITSPADGEVLTYDSGSGDWVNGAGGGGGGSTLITRTVVGVGGAASVTFSSIPGTYEDLRIVLMGRGEVATTNVQVLMRFNGDTGANYDWQKMFAAAAVEDGFGAVAQTGIDVAQLSAGTAPANAASQTIIDVLSYARTVFQKCVLGHYGIKEVTTNANYVMATAGWWRNTAAITSITLIPASGDFAEGTVASLFGVS